MQTAFYVSIWSSNSAERLQKCLRPGETVRIGRASSVDWPIPWDPKISREHATIHADEDGIEIRCLEKAANGVTYRGQTGREATIGANEWFQIGHTIFQVSIKYYEAPAPPPEPMKYAADKLDVSTHRAYSAGELRSSPIANTDRQFEALEKLPGLIASAQSDDQLCEMLSDLLIDVIPKSVAVAVAHFDESKLPVNDLQIENFPNPLSIRVKTRDPFEFFPSRKMIRECLKTQASVLHIFTPPTDSTFTLTEGVGWAFCAPIKGESGRGWCLYVSGRGTPQGGLLVTEEVLMGDLRFTQLVAEFIGSIRQVRLLQDQKSQLTTFFSPKIIDGLTKAGITVDRKVLSDLAISEPAAFASLVQKAKAAIA